jgi:serine phosphatase RsbU (regulator of sigma subunit)
LTLLLNVIILPVAFIAMKRGSRSAVLFIVAFLLLVVSVFAFVLKNFGILPSNYFTDYGFQFGSTAEVILLSLGIVIRFRNFREDAIKRLQEINDLKEKANTELEMKVTERTAEIARQKMEIEEKNEEILSSITYAKRIQEAILPNADIIERHLTNCSVLFLPKDIVAGDFYWIAERKFGGREFIFFAVGDCTGHGVPGAMMSVLCTNALNEAVLQMRSPGTSELLELCNTIVSRSLGLHSGNINDGMDISVCCMEKGKNELFWSGANHEIWVLKDGEIIEYTGTKRPIGKSHTEIGFEEQVISLGSRDKLFLFTDGLVDQFGGPDGKKFKKSRLRDVLNELSDQHPEEIAVHMRRSFMDWMGDQEQVDDVTVWILETGD